MDQMSVCEALKSLREKIDALDEKVTLLRIDVAGLNVKSGMWGLVGGLISIASLFLINFFVKR